MLPCMKGARHTPSCGCGGLGVSSAVTWCAPVSKEVSETPPSCYIPILLPCLPASATLQQPSCHVPPQEWEARGMIPGVTGRPYKHVGFHAGSSSFPLWPGGNESLGTDVCRSCPMSQSFPSSFGLTKSSGSGCHHDISPYTKPSLGHFPSRPCCLRL